MLELTAALAMIGQPLPAGVITCVLQDDAAVTA